MNLRSQDFDLENYINANYETGICGIVIRPTYFRKGRKNRAGSMWGTKQIGQYDILFQHLMFLENGHGLCSLKFVNIGWNPEFLDSN